MPEIQLTRDAALAAADGVRPQFERILKELVEIPTVSAQKEHKRDIARGVEAAQALIVAAGGKAHVLDADGGNPIVLGQLGTDPALPTVTVYNHLDVQPADQAKDGWKTDPFRCVL